VRGLLLLVVVGLVSGCVVGPNYVRPVVVAPEAYKEQDGWKIARPQDDAFRGPWWERFEDPALNALEARVSAANLNLVVAEATYRQARALVREARSAYFPTATLGVGYTRNRQSANLSGSSGTVITGTGAKGSNFFQLPLDIAWEPDFWGKVRRSVESSQAGAQASAGDLETARLSFQAELAQDYFQLRTLDAQKALLDATVAAYEQSLTLTRTRHTSGVASQVDVAQAEAQLKSAQAQYLDVGDPQLRSLDRHRAARRPAPVGVLAAGLAPGHRAAQHSHRRAVGAAAAPAGRRRRRASGGVRQRPDRRGDRRVLSDDHAERSTGFESPASRPG
jgi:NodT family efflux transporter outer membrane factor (OMF) lipoprotein